MADLQSSKGENAPATKKDDKKQKHLQYVGIGVGVIALILGYIWYKNKAANAGGAVTTTTPISSGTGVPTGYTGGGGGGYAGSTQPDYTTAFSTIDADLQGIAAMLNANAANNSTPSGAGGSGGAGGGAAPPQTINLSISTPATTTSTLQTTDTSTHPATGGGAVPFNYVRIFTPSTGAYAGTGLYALGNPNEVRAAQAAGYKTVGGNTLAGANTKATYAVPK